MGMRRFLLSPSSNMNRRTLILSLVWLWITIGVLLLFIGESGPFHFLLPEHLILLIEASKLCFIVICLPFFITQSDFVSSGRMLQEELVYVTILFLLFLPLTVLGAVLAELTWSILVLEHLLLLVFWGVVVNLGWLNRQRRLNLWRWYYLLGILISGGLPLLYYLINELYHKDSLRLLYLNPFWLIWQINQDDIFYQVWLVQIIIGLVLILVLAGLSRGQASAKFISQTSQTE